MLYQFEEQTQKRDTCTVHDRRRVLCRIKKKEQGVTDTETDTDTDTDAFADTDTDTDIYIYIYIYIDRESDPVYARLEFVCAERE